jgi:hypothetical protein
MGDQVEEQSSLDRPHKDRRRSRITNGTKLLPGVDGRKPWVRRCKDVIAAHIGDLGGADNTSAAEKSIIRRAAVLTTELERFEVKFATAGQASGEDLDLYGRVASNLRRLLEGLQRRPRVITPTVSEYLRSNNNDQRSDDNGQRSNNDVVDAVVIEPEKEAVDADTPA